MSVTFYQERNTRQRGLQGFLPAQGWAGGHGGVSSKTSHSKWPALPPVERARLIPYGVRKEEKERGTTQETCQGGLYDIVTISYTY